MEKFPFESSLFLRVLMSQNTNATSILILDRNGVILDVNTGFQKSFGYLKEDLIGKNFSILFIDKDRSNNVPSFELEKAIKNGSALDNNYIIHKDGSHLWVNGESIYIEDEINSKEYFMKIIHEINEQKILENRLIQRNEDMQRVLEDRNIFVYTASHDLQSPINNVEGLVNLLQKTPDKIEWSKIIEMIYQSLKKFRTTLNQLSDIGKIDEEVKIESSEIILERLMSDLKFDLNDEIQKADATLIVDFSKAPTVFFSLKNFRSILYNLLSNAIKFRSPDRNPQICITTDVTPDNYFKLEVSDNGRGMAEEDKDKVFEMYKRLHPDVKGTGVGMGIVKRIVENSKGKLQIDSKLGVGTTFRIYLRK